MSYKRPILKILFCVFLLLLSVCLTLTASADEKEPSKSAFEITQNCVITLNEKIIPEALTDNQEQTYIEYKEPVRITVRSPEPIGGIYLKFDRTPPEWMLIHEEDRTACGQYGFLHEYQPIEKDDITEVSLILKKRFRSVTFLCCQKVKNFRILYRFGVRPKENATLCFCQPILMMTSFSLPERFPMPSAEEQKCRSAILQTIGIPTPAPTSF